MGQMPFHTWLHFNFHMVLMYTVLVIKMCLSIPLGLSGTFSYPWGSFLADNEQIPEQIVNW